MVPEGNSTAVFRFKQDGWFKPSKTATGRVLVVGGGGAGGYGTSPPMNPGGGGEVVEVGNDTGVEIPRLLLFIRRMYAEDVR